MDREHYVSLLRGVEWNTTGKLHRDSEDRSHTTAAPPCPGSVTVVESLNLSETVSSSAGIVIVLQGCHEG